MNKKEITTDDGDYWIDPPKRSSTSCLVLIGAVLFVIVLGVAAYFALRSL